MNLIKGSGWRSASTICCWRSASTNYRYYNTAIYSYHVHSTFCYWHACHSATMFV